jgi:light-regulated signal transduction histidine kinase (bacteriophytochrome)
VLVFLISSRQKQRANIDAQRLNMVMEANHHIRNALQSISLMAQMHADDRQMEMIRESIRRVDWVLREVIPNMSGIMPEAPEFRRQVPPESSQQNKLTN